MPEHPCAEGLSAACFKAYPKWARQALAYKLLHIILPKQLTRKLPVTARPLPFFWNPEWERWFIFEWDPDSPPWKVDWSDWKPGDPLPPGVTINPDVVISPDWSPGDPLPPGVIVPPGVEFPPDWSPGDPLPPGVIVPPGVEFPPDWSPGDPLPPGVIVPPGVVFPPDWSPGDPLPPGVIVPPGVVFPPDWTPTNPPPPGVIVPPGVFFPPDWTPGDDLPPGVIIDPVVVLPPGWTPPPAPPPAYQPGPGEIPVSPETGAIAPFYTGIWEPGPIFGPGGRIYAGFNIGDLLLEQGVINNTLNIGTSDLWRVLAKPITTWMDAEIRAIDIKIGKNIDPTGTIKLEIWITNQYYKPILIVGGGESNIKTQDSLPFYSIGVDYTRFVFTGKPILAVTNRYAIIIRTTVDPEGYDYITLGRWNGQYRNYYWDVPGTGWYSQYGPVINCRLWGIAL